MYYVIANTPNVEVFSEDIYTLNMNGVPCSRDYILPETDTPTSWGWGCARFSFPAPSRQIFNAPSIEYRYSEEIDQWTVDGEVTPLSDFVKGLHEYFVTLEGNAQ